MTDGATAPPPPAIDRLPTHADVLVAATRLDGVAHRTPVITSSWLDERCGAQVFLKAETFQRVGAFKFRGAYNAIAALDPAVRARGVVAWSSGNHAQAVALSARLLGTHATIVMPEDAPAGKLAATEGYGAEVVRYDRYTESREDIGTTIAARTGAVIIPPFDHPDVIAGQGTAAKELVDEVGALDAIVTPIGGGGLAAGCALVLGAQDDPGIVIAVEPSPRDAARRALRDGTPSLVDVAPTIMDGQQTPYIGYLATSILTEASAVAVGVSEQEVRMAMAVLAQRCKLVVEPSGAAGLAALLGQDEVSGRVRGGRVGVILSGGNVDPGAWGALIGGRPV